MTEIAEAQKIYFGAGVADMVYSGATRVWPSFLPTDYSGCKIWMDASKLTGANDSSVTLWPNLADVSTSLVTDGSYPTLRTNALNGKNVVRQTGGVSRYRHSAPTGVDKDYTLFIVARKWSTAKPGRVFSSDYAAGTSNNLYGWWGSQCDCAHNSGAGWLLPAPTVGHDLDWRLYSGDGSSAQLPSRLFTNGVLIRTGSAMGDVGFANTLLLGGWNTSDRLEESDNEYAEVVMYNRRLADAERVVVEGYLRTKWGTPKWTPSELGANLLGWFDAKDQVAVAVSGQKASQWHNKAGTALTLIQTNAAYQPTYYGGQLMSFGEGVNFVAANAPTEFDMIVVAEPGVNTNWRTLMRGGTTSHHVIIETGTFRVGTYNAGFFPAGPLTWGYVTKMLYARFARIVGPPNIRLGTGPVEMSMSGGPFYSTGTTLDYLDVPFLSFGAYQGPPPSQGFGGINEIIYVTYNTPDASRLKLEGYLQQRWGAVLRNELPDAHPYKLTPP